MKKTWTMVLSMLLMIALCLSALAAEEDYKYNADYFAVVKYSGSDTDVVVPASIGGEPMLIVYSSVLNGADEAVSIALSEGVIQLRGGNLNGLDALASVALPQSLEIIGRRNFYQCDAIAEVTVPPAVAYVGEGCFSYSDALKSVRFTGMCPIFGRKCFTSASPELVVYVPDDQLDAYTAALPEGLTIKPSGKKAVDAFVRAEQGDFVFDAAAGAITGYTGAASFVEIPASIDGVPVKAIAKKAFSQNRIVSAVVIPEGVETIGESAFSGVSGLSHVVFPSSVKTIEKSAFYGAKLDGLTLNEGLEVIGEGAFNTAFSGVLAQVIIPDSVTAIGDKAFVGNTVEEFVLGSSLQSIGVEAFKNSHNIKSFVVRNTEHVSIGEKAFDKCVMKATLTLPEGILQDVCQLWKDTMAAQFPNCSVIEPAYIRLPFPALDAEAGKPFAGIWHGVAANDGTDYYPADLLGLSVDVILNEDATGSVTMDGESMDGKWYVLDGAAMFGPEVEECIPITLDENGRMTIDLGGVILILEKEGAVYTAPAIPEKPWPALDPAAAEGFIGEWEAVSYSMDGETHDAQLIGPMTVVLLDDGTAQMIENGADSGMALRWYAESGAAYFGPAMSATAALYPDGMGGLTADMDGATILFAKAVPPIEGADELMGEWFDDIGNKLTLNADRTMTMTYASDGYVRDLTWDVTDGAAAVTGGIWEGCPITLENGIVTITNGEGIYQIFSRDGDLSAVYGEPQAGAGDPAAMTPVPVGAEGASYFGTWVLEMFGPFAAAEMDMYMELTLTEDGVAAIYDGYGTEYGVWNVVNGTAYIQGGEATVNAEGKLVLAQEDMAMVFAPQGAAPSAGGDAAAPDHLQGYIGEWYMAYMNFGGMSGDPNALLGLDSMLTVNADGTASIGFPIDKSGAWYEEDGCVYFGEEGMPLTLLSDGCLQYGSQLGGYFVFSRDPEATWEPTAGQAMTLAPGVSNLPGASAAAQTAGFATMEDRLEKKFSAGSYTSFGQTMDASMLGTEYSIIFHENGLADFTLSGMPFNSLPWGLQKVSIGLSSVDAFVVNYYGTAYNFVLTDTGFDMDYYGTMTLHFVLGE